MTYDTAAEVEALLKNANAAALAHLDEGAALSQNRAVAVWREAYQKFPTKKGARCSIEALLKRVSKGEPVGSIAPTVDITNAISLKYALPIGAEDMDAFEGDLHPQIIHPRRIDALHGNEFAGGGVVHRGALPIPPVPAVSRQRRGVFKRYRFANISICF